MAEGLVMMAAFLEIELKRPRSDFGWELGGLWVYFLRVLWWPMPSG